MAADIYTKGYDDERKWKSVVSLISIVTSEFLRSSQAFELSRPTNDLWCKTLPAMSEEGVPYFTHTQTPILPPELNVPGGSGKRGWRDHGSRRFLVIKEPQMVRTSEPGLRRSSWFLKQGKWTKVEDHIDPSDKSLFVLYLNALIVESFSFILRIRPLHLACGRLPPPYLSKMVCCY